LVRDTSDPRRHVPMAITVTIPMRVRLTATTGPRGSLGASLSAPVRGITVSMDAVSMGAAFTGAEGMDPRTAEAFTAVPAMAALLAADTGIAAVLPADQLVAASVEASRGVVVGSMAAVSTEADAGN